MSEKIVVPALGESINEATIAKWLKNKGDTVSADEPIVELETDKVNLEVPSPVSGTLSKINSKDGSTVEVGAVLGEVTESDTEKKVIEKIKTSKSDQKKEENNVVNLDIEKRSEPSIFEEKEVDSETLVLTNEISKEKSTKINKSLSPSVRKIISEKKININEIQGSGKDGRILKGDLINLMGVNPKPNERKIQHGQEERIKMTRLRQTIAKRLKQAQENAAIMIGSFTKFRLF